VTVFMTICWNQSWQREKNVFLHCDKPEWNKEYFRIYWERSCLASESYNPVYCGRFISYVKYNKR